MATTKKTTKKKATKKKVAKATKGGVRIWEIAQSLGADSPTVLAVAQGLGIDATNHMSVVSQAQAQQIRNAYAREEPAPAQARGTQRKKKARKKKTRKGKQGAPTTITIQQGAGNPKLKDRCLTIIAGCGC